MLKKKHGDNIIKEIEKCYVKKECEDIGMKKKAFQSKCPICQCNRIYKSIKGWKLGLNKPCKSCSNSINLGGKGDVKPKNGKKICSMCKNILEIDKFTKYKNGRFHSYCNECKLKHFRNYQKLTGRFKRFGITIDDYQKMFIKQRGKCKICKMKFDVLCIDHNHTTQKIRGLLCRVCNVGLGCFSDNIKILKTAALYLEKNNGIK